MHTHTRILKPFEDSERTGLKEDIAHFSICFHSMGPMLLALLSSTLPPNSAITGYATEGGVSHFCASVHQNCPCKFHALSPYKICKNL